MAAESRPADHALFVTPAARRPPARPSHSVCRAARASVMASSCTRQVRPATLVPSSILELPSAGRRGTDGCTAARRLHVFTTRLASTAGENRLCPSQKRNYKYSFSGLHSAGVWISHLMIDYLAAQLCATAAWRVNRSVL